MLPPASADRSKRLKQALPAVSQAVRPTQVSDGDFGATWNELRRGLTDLKKDPQKLDSADVADDSSIDDVWEFMLNLMPRSPKYARQLMDAVAMLLNSRRWAEGLLRARDKQRLSLWKLSSASSAEESPVELAARILKLGVPVDDLLPKSALDSGLNFVEDLAAKLSGKERESLDASQLGAAWRDVQQATSTKRSTDTKSDRFLPEQRSAEDLGTLAEANQAQAASIEAAGKKDKRPGCRKDVADNLLDLTERALNVAEKYLEPMLSGYAGEMNIASSAKAKVKEFRDRQANLQAQLVVMGPCQVGKTSLTYSLVGFAALPPSTPSMVTTRWVHTPNLAVPRLSMPEALSKLLQSWSERLASSDVAQAEDVALPHVDAAEGIDAVAQVLDGLNRLVHRGRILGIIKSQELEALSRPSMCVTVDVAFAALVNLEEALTDTGTLSIIDLPSPDGDVLWESQDVQLLCKRALQEADGVLVVVDASTYEVPRWMGKMLREAFVQERLLRRDDAWIVANHIDQLAEFFCKDGIADVCRRVKQRQYRDYRDVILSEDHVIPTAARLSLLAIYGKVQVNEMLSPALLTKLDREPWFAQICSFLFGVHWVSKVKDMELTTWRRSMKELQLMGQVTGPLTKSVLQTAYVKMLPRSVARVMFDLSQLISTFVSSLGVLEGTSNPIDAEELQRVFQTYFEDVQKRVTRCLHENAPAEETARQLAAAKCSAPVVLDDANSTELNENHFSFLAREVIQVWDPNFAMAVNACCGEAARAHQKWLRSLDHYLTKGGADAATKQKLLLDSKNLKLLSSTEGCVLLQNSERDMLVIEHAGKVEVTTSKQLFQRTKRTYLIKPENTSGFVLQLLRSWLTALEAEITRRCIQPIKQNFDDLCHSIEELNSKILAGAERRKDSTNFDFTFAHKLAEVLPRVASFNACEDSMDVMRADEADRCQTLCEEVQSVLQDIEKGLP
eukprot:TRINITY_DN32033_c0_g1_i1.p1 TRINITY_DN32033_c0_g1~~TRINITY_DN32033_c0_g1_i1.p1  ORF type:complete len:976 (-),score=224.38 TRINITY_DN32033_c0_g1_i1:26-2908(-)